MSAPKKVFIKTFGCQMNEYDSSRMMDLMQASDGMQQTDNPADADVILLNTCSVRDKPQEKVFSHLGRFWQLKQKNPNLVIGVGGCVASQEGAAIVERAPYVDIVFGPQTLHRLPAMIAEKRATGLSQVDISFPEIEKFDRLPPPRVEGGAAFLSIMEGCSKYCSFCVVPYTRGEEVSRPFDDVLLEAAQLVRQGVKEITLLGQNVNAYRGPMTNGGSADLPLLLEYLHEVPGLERLRYTTSHPNEMTPALIDAYTRLPKLVSHLHLPVQGGSDRILAAMKRNYTTLQYKSLIRKLRAARPDLSLTSDFIIGFPGETWQEIRETVSYAETCGADYVKLFVAVPLKRTRLWDLALAQNAIEDPDSYRVDWRFSQIKSDQWSSKDVSVLRAYEWDRINFATPERRERVAELWGIAPAELEAIRKQTRDSIVF